MVKAAGLYRVGLAVGLAVVLAVGLAVGVVVGIAVGIAVIYREHCRGMLWAFSMARGACRDVQWGLPWQLP